jgi:holo-[acyl-carrier protein] synthase
VTGLGIDLCGIARIEAAIRNNEGFLARYYTEEERAYLDGRGAAAADSAAAMFAAKEAFLKALGTGLAGGVSMADVGVLHDALGCPAYRLAPKARELMEQKGARAAYLSLAHDAGVAAAVCVLE